MTDFFMPGKCLSAEIVSEAIKDEVSEVMVAAQSRAGRILQKYGKTNYDATYFDQIVKILSKKYVHPIVRRSFHEVEESKQAVDAKLVKLIVDAALNNYPGIIVDIFPRLLNTVS